MFVWFNKNNNLKLRFRTSKNATCIEKPKCSHLISTGKSERCFLDRPFVYFSGSFIPHLFGDYANINM